MTAVTQHSQRAALRAIAERVSCSPPSAGAHRLGWWLAGSADPVIAVRRLCTAAGVTSLWVERVLTGEIVEIDGDVARQIAFVTAHAVMPEDWARPGAARWEATPLPRIDAVVPA